MKRFLFQRLATLLVSLLVLLILFFSLMNLLPEPNGQFGASPGAQRRINLSAQRELRAHFHLDKPTLLNFDIWASANTVASWLNDVKKNSENPYMREKAISRILAAYPYLGEQLSVLCEESSSGVHEFNLLAKIDICAENPKPQVSKFDRSIATLSETRVFYFLKNVLSLDFGHSTRTGKRISTELYSRLGSSFGFGTAGFLLSIPTSILLALFLSVRGKTIVGAAIEMLISLIIATPVFVLSAFILLLFAEGYPLAIFPPAFSSSIDYGRLTVLGKIFDSIWHYTLPVVCYSAVMTALLTRLAKTQFQHALREPATRLALSRGLSQRFVLFHYVLPNGALPLVAVLGGVLPSLVSGSVLLEVIFEIRGIGHYLFESVLHREYSAIAAGTFLLVLATLVGVFVADLFSRFLDPRIRFLGK